MTGTDLCVHKPHMSRSYLNHLVLWNNTLDVSDSLSVHHQESKTVHTASYHTASVAAC